MKDILKYKGFWSKVNYEEETSTFWGKLEEIEDLITFESNTIEGLEQEFKDVVEEYIEECEHFNKGIKRESFNIVIEPELHEKAIRFARSFNISLNQFVAKAIRDEIEVCEKQKI